MHRGVKGTLIELALYSALVYNAVEGASEFCTVCSCHLSLPLNLKSGEKLNTFHKHRGGIEVCRVKNQISVHKVYITVVYMRKDKSCSPGFSFYNEYSP